MTARKPEYVLPGFLSFHQQLTKEKWTEDTMISDVIAGIYENIENFHKSERIRRLRTNQTEDRSSIRQNQVSSRSVKFEGEAIPEKERRTATHR